MDDKDHVQAMRIMNTLALDVPASAIRMLYSSKLKQARECHSKD